MTWWPTTPSWLYGDPRYLVSPQSKLREILAPSNQPSTHVQWQGHGSLGAWRRHPQLGQAQQPPVFYNTNGQAISSSPCGSAYGFTVPGWEGQQVYIIQTKNGAPQYSGLFSVPMPPYTALCSQDEGTYQLTAFDPTSGSSLGSVQFQVLPSGAQSQPPGPIVSTVAPGPQPPGGPPLPVHVAGSLNLTPTTMIIAAAAAYFLLARRRS